MPQFDPARARLLLQDVDRSTIGEMGAVVLQLTTVKPPRLEIRGDRLVRFAVRLALQAIRSEDNFFINTYGHIAGSSVLDSGGSVEVVLTGPPLEPDPEPVWRDRWTWSRPGIFALGVSVGMVVGALMSWLL